MAIPDIELVGQLRVQVARVLVLVFFVVVFVLVLVARALPVRAEYRPTADASAANRRAVLQGFLARFLNLINN